MAEPNSGVLTVQDLNVLYGHSHALQGVNLTLQHEALSVVGRNGMGKTTLCNAIMGLVPVSSGSVHFNGRNLVGLPSSEIARLGVGYVPQGRRIWPSLTVDEHFRIVAKADAAWNIDRVYSTFPRLADRRSHLGRHLSGGEQQMLAIGRALLLNPKLLVMDEPTEGLAPMIVRQVTEILVQLESDSEVGILVIEQNIGVACTISKQVAIMVNGRINRIMDSATLAGDRSLQQTLLGVGRHAEDAVGKQMEDRGTAPEKASRGIVRIYVSNPKTPSRWSRPVPVQVIERSARTSTQIESSLNIGSQSKIARTRPVGNTIFVAGTLDTKREEIIFIRDVIRAQGHSVRIVDVSTSGSPSTADVTPSAVAGFHPRGYSGVFTNDRGTAVAGMTLAFERWVRHQQNIVGMIGIGGSGGTALIAPGMRTLSMGVPKVMVSTVASGDVSQYVGASDMLMFHSVADVQGLNSITKEVFSNAAWALAGMVGNRKKSTAEGVQRPTVGITMFGVTTPCVQQICTVLQDDYDCLVFHATGTGGRCMESLMDSGKLNAIIDITTTEVCDMIAGGIFPADEDRLGASVRAGLPYIGSCGALDMVNFGSLDTVPEQYLNRNLYEHNPQITLMRTTAEENSAIGRWIGQKLNEMTGPVRFLLPEGGVSQLDSPDRQFWDPVADQALFRALEDTVRQSELRKLIRTTYNVNDTQFADLVVQTFRNLHALPVPNSRRFH